MKGLLLITLLLCPSPALACEIDTPTAWLPGFTKQQVDERATEILNAWSTIRQHERTEALVAGAPIIYLARVAKSDRDMALMRFSTTLEPLQAIKGRMPASRVLEGSMPSSCDDANGDGDGAYAPVGELVVVFEGVSKLQDGPRGIDSVRMRDVLSGSLLDPVQEWLSKQPGYVPY